MAIQQINLGSAPSGAGGDTQRAANEKINQNFSNQAHAASRLVGTESGNVMEVGAFGIGRPKEMNILIAKELLGKIAGNVALTQGTSSDTEGGALPAGFVMSLPWGDGSAEGIAKQLYFSAYSTDFKIRERPKYGATYATWQTVYHTGNTTKDTATGFLKASSPVLHVYNDKITKIHEAEQLDIKVDKKGIGHYEIHGTTGLRKNDGWFMSPPRDVHGNVLCMVDLEEKEGVVTLRTYKKKFDFETVSIVHDFDNPMDIPEGVCVEFRFNDLPQEQLDEPIE